MATDSDDQGQPQNRPENRSQSAASGNGGRITRRSVLAGAGMVLPALAPVRRARGQEDEDRRQVEGALGELIEGERIHLVVEETTRDLEDARMESLDLGLGSYFVQLAIKNVTDEHLPLGIWATSEIIDDENYAYDWSAGSTSPFVGGGLLSPGEVERGYLGYDVPSDATEASLRFDFSRTDLFPAVDEVRIDLTEEADPPHELEQTYEPELYDVGTEVQMEGWDITLKSTEITTQLGEYTEAEDGYEFVTVDVRLVNNTDALQTLVSYDQLLLKDGDHLSYPLNWGVSNALSRKITDFLDIPAGEERQGMAAYIVEEDLEPLYWVFDSSHWDLNARSFWQIR